MANRRMPGVANPADPALPEPGGVRPPPRASKSPPAAEAPKRLQVTPEARRALIAESAYLRAERRGFEPGHENEDWLAAEQEVDALLTGGHGGSS
jgi:Protein of unknown function (DUF2934)